MKNAWFSVIVVSVLFSIFGHVLADSSAHKKFVEIDCRKTKTISETRIFMPTCDHGILTTAGTYTPLQNEVDKKIKTSVTTKRKFTTAVLVQAIPTKGRFSYYLDGGKGYKNLLNGLYRALGPLGYNILRVAELLLDLVTSVFPSSNLSFIVVDNALPNGIVFTVTGSGSVNIPARSQANVAFKKGIKNFRVTSGIKDSVVGELVIDEFSVDTDVESRTTSKGAFVYNIGGTNQYTWHFVNYSK